MGKSAEVKARTTKNPAHPYVGVGNRVFRERKLVNDRSAVRCREERKVAGRNAKRKRPAFNS
jgi:hypothetical protein